MSDKGENCLTFVLWWSFIIILFTTVFLLGFSFIYYSQISLDSKISSFFSFTSTFGIVATITVYFLQKKHSIELENKKNERIDSSISKILLMECQRIGYDVEFMQKSYMFLSQKKPDNPEVKKDGIYYYIMTGFGEQKRCIRYFYRMDTSKLMEALRLAVNNNSKYFDTIYQFIDDVDMVNNNLDNWLFDVKFIYQENNIYNMSLSNLYRIINEIYH
ncbi:TPA: hypothetical protein RG700_001738 [Proteus mirabilis]|nr:hypothetical protein [Proteus mirabilis]AZH06002.1 hypothetical protein EHQ78_09945 [Proteus mirabilis]EJD6087259.1 hypothetical protein [Proteus mirabilis]ELA7950686.1 hypothetical protein [Proteus mirabilis]EMB4672727.1 hypothetical protein [Proteus mirabilis]MBG2844560.1 hypothetical protein [Proteus mirabilis]